MTVLVWAGYDTATDRVVVELRRRGAGVHRLDPTDVPKLATVTATVGPDRGWAGTISTPYRTTTLGEVTAVYCRVPWSPRLGALLAGTDVRPDVRWVDHPLMVTAAVCPPRQLEAAAAVGLTVPECLLATDPDEARPFITSAPDGVVYQALCGQQWSAPAPATVDRLFDGVTVYRRVTPGEWVRVMVVGQRCFAARGVPGERVCEPVELPPALVTQCCRLVAVLGLTVAVVDLTFTPAGQVVFTGLDPLGQWLWCVEDCGVPVDGWIADLLSP